MKSLVIGAGQIGRAIHEIVEPFHEAAIRDVQENGENGPFDVLHICYPDSIYFVNDTVAYIKKYKPSVTLIHSSIEVGKTARCGDHVVSCPVRGRHPNLSKEIPAFVLFLGSENKEDIAKATEYFEACHLVVCPVDDPNSTELCKLLSNVHMALEVSWRQEVERILKHFDVNSTVYERWEETYNEGYRITGDEQLTRPRLKPDPIGGHCLLQCTEILANAYPSKLLDFIGESNDKAKKETTRTRETVS